MTTSYSPTKPYTLLKAYIFSLCFFCCSLSIVAQTRQVSIRKNMNVQAKNLYHDLNATKDTLVLRSDANINYVYSINKNVKRELSYTVNDKSLNVPLDKLSDGRHVFVVVQSPMRIVFVVNVTREYDEDLASAELELVSSDNR